MSILQLAVMGEYFAAMKAGMKPFEYRLDNAYWRRRLVGRDYEQLVITWGYPARSDMSRRLILPWLGYEMQTITHPHFGDKPVNVFAIRIGDGVCE
ncbi:ASCH domain-containing protein [Dickeya lacustris]|uniref:ASCH domain-containing protein n=1 Tax=Dickeya lacustris TaxID=2259638 RepID=A0ABY8G6G5_9GAMM|nr:ASCH domain-containing protein [Dickeya lacustris]WFN55534.1 ASCH domain-containing protein [Dickeya lacustris]